MSPNAFADMLEQIAVEVLELPGVSRTRPHAFLEAKSELRGKILRTASELRTGGSRPLPKIHPGARLIGRREVTVERRIPRSEFGGRKSTDELDAAAVFSVRKADQ